MAPAAGSTSQIRGAKRSTKVAGKLKVLPEQPESKPADDTAFRIPAHTESPGKTGESDDGDIGEEEEEEEPEVEVCNLPNLPLLASNVAKVYDQISLIPEGTAKRDALRLTKKKAKSLPRVTAYATAR
jgi:hypothetical protein